jgi:hypothetical protein
MNNNDEKIIKALEDLQSGQEALRADVQKQGKQLGTIQSDVNTIQFNVKGLHGKVDAVELKVEAIHTYQKQTHDEIMNILFESNEINGKAQRVLEKRIERIEKHLGLPPLK